MTPRDSVNEGLLRAGYEVRLLPTEQRRSRIRLFSDVSSGFVNFARKAWFGRGYTLACGREHWARIFRNDEAQLERACGVAAILVLHRHLFGEEPRFSDFFTYDDLEAIAASTVGISRRDGALSMIRGYRELLTTLKAAITP